MEPRSSGPASTRAMRSFWDRKARENAMWFVHSTLDYAHPDAEEFWRSGSTTLDSTLSPFGVTFTGEERVLEVGCGVGRMTKAIAARAASVVGVDVSAEMVERASANLADTPNIEIVQGNGRDLSQFEDQSFDAAYSFIVFHHIPDPGVTCGYITEIGRVLRPDGWTVFHVSEDAAAHRPENRPTQRRVRDRARRFVGRAPKGTTDAQWVGSAVTRPALLDALEKGGLQFVASKGDGTLYCLVHARRRAD